MYGCRIVQPHRAPTALSGEGARLYGGRWNSPGRPCVYAAESRALAILEMLVHLTARTRGRPWRLLTLDIPDDLVGRLGPPPDGWDAMPPGPASQAPGDAWLETAASAVLRVPSVLVPEEFNLLINPLVPSFERIRVVGERDYSLDSRLS